MSGSPAGTVASTASLTHVPVQSDTNDPHSPRLAGGEGASAMQGGTVGDKIEDIQNDWEHDPANPRNWAPARKWITISLVSLYSFVSPLASSIMAPGLPDVAIKYDISNPTVTALTLSIFILSFAIGPLLLAPSSEMYGRVWVLHLSNLFFLAFNLGCALSPNVTSLIIFRFLAGFVGSAPIVCGSGVVSDLFVEHERASAMAVYSLAPLIGPSIGPVMGGFIAESVGIQYVFYVIVSICGVAAVLGISLLRETYAPVIRRRRDKIALDPEKSAVGHPVITPYDMGRWTYIWINLKRPVILFTRSFICFVLSLYMSLMYGIYYLMFSTFPSLFSDVYHFSIGMGGLAYIGLGLGFLLSAIVGAKLTTPWQEY